MSQIPIRDYATDSYQILTSYSNTSSETERAIVQALVEGSLDPSNNISGHVYTSPANDTTWTHTDLSSNYVNTSAIFNYPAGTVSENSVIRVDLSNNDASFNSYTVNISSIACGNNDYTFQSEPTSAPYYNCNYVVESSHIQNCYDDASAVRFAFDMADPNLSIEYAMQSRWNTTLGPYIDLSTVGPDPLATTQDVSYNTLEAFGMKGTGLVDPSGSNYTSYWASTDPSDGSVVFHTINTIYQPNTNNLFVEERALDASSSFTLTDDIGVYRFQQPDHIIATNLNDASINNVDLLTIPMFNANGPDPLEPNSAKTDSSANLVPGEMTYSQFTSLFDLDVLNTIRDGWTFSIDISSNDNSGYTIQPPHPAVSNLNNSNILDNLYYMANYVSNPHHIDISSGTLTIDPSLNADILNANSIIIDTSNGERLNTSDAGTNGQIIMNLNTINTRYADMLASNPDISNNVFPMVRYEAYDASNIGIDLNERNTYTFEVFWQKVAQQSEYAPATDYIKTNNNAILTLSIANQVVDSSYNASDFDFSFNPLYAPPTDLALWRLDVNNSIIIEPNSLYIDPTYTTAVNGISTLGYITGLTEALTYNNYRDLLTAKIKEDIGLYTAVSTNANWSLDYTNIADTFLSSSSDQAYAESGHLPNYSNYLINLINSGYDMSFSYLYATKEDSLRPGGLVDYVEITYNYMDPSSGLVNVVDIIPQTSIVRDYTDSSSVFVDIAENLYSFTGPIFNSATWKLVQVITTSHYSATFPAVYGPFDNINLTVSNILQTDTYYAVQNRLSGQLAPHSSLNYVLYPSITESDLKNVNETITSTSPLEISGLFTADDLKPFYSVIQGSNVSDVWTTISDTTSVDTYYGLTNTNDINNVSSEQVSTNIEYNPTSNGDPVALSNLNYYIPFFIDLSNNTHTLTSYTYNANQIPTTTTMSSTDIGNNTSYLTVQNNYNVTNIGSWSSTTYNLITESVGLDTLLIARDSSNNVVFSIKFNNTTIFLGTFIISYIPLDIMRADRLLGSGYQENFATTSYDYVGYPNGDVFALEGIPGVYINRQDTDFDTIYGFSDPATRPVLGSYQQFRVIGDYATFAAVGLASVPTSANELGLSSYNSGSLYFQYTNLPYYSAIFEFPYYRGYEETTNADQIYTIVRTSTVADFIVDGSGLYTTLTDNLTTNMYYAQTFIVNDLQDLSGNTCANLNVDGSFNYSILPNMLDVSYVVDVVGDDVLVTISNPNYTSGATNIPVPSGATPVVDPTTYSAIMTLKDYGQNNMYTFSGLWYINNALMAIRPSRVKLTNAAYAFTDMNYSIIYDEVNMKLYKALNPAGAGTFNWLGNPEIHSTQNYNVNPSALEWQLIGTYNRSQIETGFDIGSKHIYISTLLSTFPGISYYISTAPYNEFEQIDMSNCPVIPYDYTTDYIANRQTRYYPYTSGASFNPFATSVTYRDINDIATTVTNQYVNNVTFTLLDPPSLIDTYTNPDPTRYGAIVPGTNLNIKLYIGPYPSTDYGTRSTPVIYNAPITSMSSLADISNNTTGALFRTRDASGGIHFSLLQYPTDIGYPSGAAGYEAIFHTTNQSQWYNNNFDFGNTAWYDASSVYFDFYANGVYATLYTVTDMNDPLSQTNYRRVYKYISPNPVVLDASGSLLSGIETLTLNFTERSYCDIDISGGTFGTSGIWHYPTILLNTNIGDASTNWIIDASFSGSYAYTGWSFGNSTTSTNMIIELLGVQDNEQKWTYITLEPFMSYRNQFGVQVSSVAWDGSITTPLVKARVVQLYPAITNPVLTNNTTAIEQYSESTLN